MDIETNLRAYLADLAPSARYASFDYCFNHFQSQRQLGLAGLTSGAGMEVSCLQLAFYLASWGMLRGSTDLIKRSSKHYEPVIEAIAAADPRVWEIDADAYTDDAIELLFHVGHDLRSALTGGATNTLVTKIMLGVFGCVPAFDTRFKSGFKVSTFDKGALQRIADFYEQNAEMIDRHRIPTLDFSTGQATELRYTRAKVIDMIFFIEGGP